MDKANSIIKMVECMMDHGRKIRWMDMDHCITNQVKLHIRECGKGINFKVMENYTMKIHKNSMDTSIIGILMRLMNLGNTMKVTNS